jgi:hypothetical protein
MSPLLFASLSLQNFRNWPHSSWCHHEGISKPRNTAGWPIPKLTSSTIARQKEEDEKAEGRCQEEQGGMS